MTLLNFLFNDKDAETFGVESAIILHYIKEQQSIPPAKPEIGLILWICIEEISRKFYFLSVLNIKSHISELISKNILETKMHGYKENMSTQFVRFKIEGMD
jgi:hypothetical protein